MKNFYHLFVVFFSITILIAACASTDKNSGKKTKLEREIELVKTDSKMKNRELDVIGKMYALKGKYGEKVISYIKKDVESLLKSLPAHSLDTFKASPSRDVDVPADIARLLIKNDYPSGNMLIHMKNGDNDPIYEILPNNTEKTYDVNPGTYSISIVVDRKFNTNKYKLANSVTFSGGELYMGSFAVSSTFNKSGSCPENTITDDDTCMSPKFELFDNCPSGTHLVNKQLCCEEGLNFILDGHCSRYPAVVENVVCPTGTHDVGGGRCCPRGTVLIDNKCQPKKEKK